MSRPLLIVLAACWGAGMARAVDPPSRPAAADLTFFEQKVRPLLAEHCYRCHSTKAKKVKGGLLLDSRATVLKGGDSGPALVPGKPDNSLLIKAVRYQTEALQMPPKGRLPARDVAVLVEWVRRGAPMPDTGAVGAARHEIDLARGRTFWSFQLPRAQPLPSVRDRTWPRRRIDTFLLAEMEHHGLAPAPAASRAVLIRRLSFDLVGLPPAPEEVAAFVRDEAPDAYARLVERLLASPRHGERWGRFWLDLARYCDVGEPWSDAKGKPHLYRDWVVRALNADLPYDQFVQRQLAADLMPEAAPADRAALGFLGLSPTYWKELKLDKDVIRTVVAEEWEERIQAVGGTFLGLTIACARCHDHKFDPITQTDYYALAGVLASSRIADRSLLPDAIVSRIDKARARVRSLEKEIDKLHVRSPGSAEARAKIDELHAQIDAIRKQTPHYDDPMAPGLVESSLHVLADGPHRTKLEWRPGVAQDVALQVRGNPASAGPLVPRRFLLVLAPDAPQPFRQGSGRLELARALVREGAPLSARVIVNRVWRHHFGTGLVETPSDFGAQGARPSHPALLDDLTYRFMASGWSLKWLHREIVLSAAYQQASRFDASKHALDPDNRWLARMNRRRLEVEAWRDSMLAVGGSLETTIGGPAVELGKPQNRRRTLYGLVRRRELNDLLRLNDFPDPTAHSPARVPTTTPLQQLFVLNSPFMQQQAAALVRRLKADAGDGVEARVQRAYRLLYGRPATPGQVKCAVEFLGAAGSASEAAWQEYAQVLLASNAFLFVD